MNDKLRKNQLLNEAIRKIQLLNEKLENPYGRLLFEGTGKRIQVSRDQIIDKMNDMAGDIHCKNKYVTIVYAQAVGILSRKTYWDVSDLSKKLSTHPELADKEWHKRLSDYNQEGVKGKNPVTGVIVTKRFWFPWKTRAQYGAAYDEYNTKMGDLRMSYGYGLDRNGAMGDAHNIRGKFDDKTKYNQSTGNLSLDVNMVGKKETKTTYYYVDDNGRVTEDNIMPSDIVNVIRKSTKKHYPIEREMEKFLNGDEEKIKAYIEAKRKLDTEIYDPRNLLFDRILSICATVNGESFYYINDSIGFDFVDKQDMVKIAQSQIGECFNVIDSTEFAN